MAFGEGCDTVLINLDDGGQVIADKLGRLQSLAGSPLRVGRGKAMSGTHVKRVSSLEPASCTSKHKQKRFLVVPSVLHMHRGACRSQMPADLR